jgi:phospholipid/cholesterol/gamma-HCH transport system substrate-binding protein
MTGQTRKFKIGLFVVTSFMLGVGVVIWLGASRYLQSTKTVVTYFSESVQGLEIDSPVKFRGVSVGRVKRIRMAPDNKRIEVIMSLDQTFLITEDLGITINLLGLTGQKYLEMDRLRPGQKPEPIRLTFDPPHQVIKSYPSGLKDLGDKLDNISRKVRAVDMERISNHLANVASKLDAILSDPKIGNIGRDAAEAVEEVKTAAKRINNEIARMQLSRRVGKTMDEAAGLLQAAGRTTSSADRMIRRTDNNIQTLSRKLNRIADDMKYVTSYLKEKPSCVWWRYGLDPRWIYQPSLF